jgi:meso-butanediol dehydrogenase/(S,S)-butanediol dehydrogenase/diacetyl reductase
VAGCSLSVQAYKTQAGGTHVAVSLEGRIALVTGGGRGIGLGIATSLAQAGADVVIADYTQELAEVGAHEVAKLGRRSAAIQVDVRKP